MGYSTINLAICLMAAAYLYNLIQLFSTIFNGGLVGNSEDITLSFESCYDDGGK